MSGTNILTATSAVPFLKCSLIDQNNKKALGVVSIEKFARGTIKEERRFSYYILKLCFRVSTLALNSSKLLPIHWILEGSTNIMFTIKVKLTSWNLIEYCNCLKSISSDDYRLLESPELPNKLSRLSCAIFTFSRVAVSIKIPHLFGLCDATRVWQFSNIPLPIGW